MGDFLTDNTSLLLAKCLDGISVRHKVIANNIANIDTPGFTRSEVDFESELAQAISSGDEGTLERRIRDVEPTARLDASSPAGPNGNNVSIDREMAEMSKNSLQYEALIQLMTLRGSMIKSAITEGRR